MNVASINPDDDKWFNYLSEKRIEKVKKLKRREQKAESIGAELLLRRAVKDITGTDEIPLWDTDKNGKLYLARHNDIYVNLSHSGDYAACVSSSSPVGIDIQKYRECDIKTAKRFFSPDETAFIESSSDLTDAFFFVWTRKESLTKAAGKGIAVNMRMFSVLDPRVTFDGNLYKFIECSNAPKGYRLSVCSLV